MEYDIKGFGGVKVKQDDLLYHPTDLFNLAKYEESFENSYRVNYTAENLSDKNGPYRINIVGNTEDYIDTRNIDLSMKFKYKKGDTGVTYHDVSLVNLICSSIFDSVQVDINGKPMTDLTQEEFGYKTYLQKILSTDVCKLGTIAREYFAFDDAGTYAMDAVWKDFDSETPVATVTKSRITDEARLYGVWLRRAVFATNGEFQVYTSLSIDCLQAGRLFPPNTSITLTFKKKPQAFYMLGKVANMNTFSLEVQDMKLSVPFFHLKPELKLYQDRFLQSQPYTVPFDKCIPIRKQFGVGMSDLSYDNMITGEIPKHICAILVETASYDGDYARSPYCFQHCFVESVSLRINNRPYPSDMIMCDFEHENYAEQYNFALRNTGCGGNNKGHLVGYSEYAKDYTHFPFDFSPEKCNGFHFHPIEQGNVDLKIKLRKGLTKSMTLLVFASYNKVISFDKNRDVKVISI